MPTRRDTVCLSWNALMSRPLRRTIQRLVENELSTMVLNGSVQPGDKITVEAKGDELTFDVESGGAQIDDAEQEEAAEPAATRA